MVSVVNWVLRSASVFTIGFFAMVLTPELVERLQGNSASNSSKPKFSSALLDFRSVDTESSLYAEPKLNDSRHVTPVDIDAFGDSDAQPTVGAATPGASPGKNSGVTANVQNPASVCTVPTGVVPAGGSILLEDGQPLSWVGNANCEYWVYTGEFAKNKSYSDSGNLGGETSYTIDNYPLDGSDVYVTLYYRPLTGGSWQNMVLHYSAPGSGACTAPVGILPASGSILSKDNQLLSWDSNANCEYWVYTGESAKSKSYSDSGNLGGESSNTIFGYPAGGSDVYVTLYYRPLSGGRWRYVVLDYTAPGTCTAPTGISPASGSNLTESSQSLSWDRNENCEYWVYAGDAARSRTYADSGNLHTNNVYSVDSYPADGSTVFVTLYYRPLSGGVWQHEVLSYVASGNVAARLDEKQAWIELTPNPAPARRVELGAVEIDGKIYALGGMIHGNRTPVNKVEVYDPEVNSWAYVTDIPEPMNHFQPVAYDGKIYIIGALEGTGFPQESGIPRVHIYDTRTDTWSLGGDIPADRVRGAAAATLYNEKIYIVGGNTLGHLPGSVDWFDEYDPKTGIWRTLPSLPEARDHVTVAVSGDSLVAAGGRQGWVRNVTSTHIFRFDTNQWVTTADDIPTPRSGAMAVAVGDEVVLIGGETNQKLAHDEVEAVDVHSGKWRALQSLRNGRHASGAAILDNAIHIFSGNTTKGLGDETNSHEILPF